ncbi:N-acetylmuramoyl-L-alanine amidase LytC precursor [Clostridium ragsdalei P11]|uniref:N-acetylmuramoyl-L-alanine amidase LytC n=1 Tax=Clostridium ragsdalei P11 TaxID=1353534 RepID=A0A1A6AIC6_9CLOT|nr:cell wall-binding repeat-containing protein [Clostridium ragsdalei]OBR89824.1 N-acetylmuramoyl-L-alanine amidase LytC precursor [Clostridium ragsdalei P11]
MKKTFLPIITTIILSFSIFFTSQVSAASQTKRLGGQNRIETSVEIATDYNNGQLQAVVVTTANDFPEALTGSTLAAKCKAPILLVDTTVEDNQKTLDYIKCHLASNGTVYILGQTTSVSSDVENAIRNMGYTNIKRLAGANKEETFKVINSEVNVATGTPVFIASEDNFPDALSASGIAAVKGYPIILCSHGVVSQSAIDQLNTIKPAQVYVVGGQAVVPESTVQQVMSITGLTSDKMIRLSGKDRYETSLAINKKFNLTTENAIVASGEKFPDALVGSSLAAKYNAPIIFTDGGEYNYSMNGNNIVEQIKYLQSINCSNLIILGKESAVSKSVEDILGGNGSFRLWVKGASISNNKNYITGCFERFVYCSDPDVFDATKAYEKATGDKILSDYEYRTGDIGFEGFHMDISTPITLEVANNVDFNNILQHNYNIRSIFDITFQNGIVKKILDQHIQ